MEEEDKDVDGSLTQLKAYLRKVFKWALYLLMIVSVAGLSTAFYYFYQNHLDLTYETNAECKQHSSRKQICTNEDGHLFLRHVERKEGRSSVSDVFLDGETGNLKYRFVATWLQECEDGIEITLRETVYSTGEPYRLLCTSNRLSTYFVMDSKTSVSFDELGFQMEHSYLGVDYSMLERQLALSSAENRADRLLKEEAEAKKALSDQKAIKARKVREEKNLRLAEEEKERARKEKAESQKRKRKQKAEQAARVEAERQVAARKLEQKKQQAEKQRLKDIASERKRILAKRDEKQSRVIHLMPSGFFEGSIRLKIGFSAGYRNGSVKSSISSLLSSGNFTRIAQLVSGSTENSENYYLLGRAAEAYEAYDAAGVYYRLSLRTSKDCTMGCATGYSKAITRKALARVNALL